MTTAVVNISAVRHLKENGKSWPDPYVYIGRPSKWGNPFLVGKDGTREEVVEKYRAWLADVYQSREGHPSELKDKTLVCWCAPLPCHGDVLAELADSE